MSNEKPKSKTITVNVDLGRTTIKPSNSLKPKPQKPQK